MVESAWVLLFPCFSSYWWVRFPRSVPSRCRHELPALAKHTQRHWGGLFQNTGCGLCLLNLIMQDAYMIDCLQLYTPSCTLRSASGDVSLQIPRTGTSSAGSRAFSHLGLSTLNDLPLPFRQKSSRASFKRNLKNKNPKTIDLCFLCRAAVFIHLKSVCCPF